MRNKKFNRNRPRNDTGDRLVDKEYKSYYNHITYVQEVREQFAHLKWRH